MSLHLTRWKAAENRPCRDDRTSSISLCQLLSDKTDPWQKRLVRTSRQRNIGQSLTILGTESLKDRQPCDDLESIHDLITMGKSISPFSAPIPFKSVIYILRCGSIILFYAQKPN